jgi:soluble lytic murein transglycosylase-like protein
MVWGTMIKRSLLGAAALAVVSQPAAALDGRLRDEIDALVAKHAAAHDVPEALVHRVIVRESRYNPRAVGRGGTMGLMQIKHATARALGYAGPASGLLDAGTNLTYGVRYLAGAYRVAGGDHDRAVALFARGYYYEAKRKGLLASIGRKIAPLKAAEVEAKAEVRETAVAAAPALPPPEAASPLSLSPSLFTAAPPPDDYPPQ